MTGLSWRCFFFVFASACASDTRTVVSKSGCTCATECGMSYEEPHHDTHFCHVATSECTEGCDCHLDTPDADGKPWDFCDPQHTLDIAWIQAPAFSQSALRKTGTTQATKALAASSHGQSEGKTSLTGATSASKTTDNATSAASKRMQLAMQEATTAHRHVKQVEKKDSLTISEEEDNLKIAQSRLTASLVVSGVVALCGLSLAGCMLAQIWRSSSTKQELDDAKVKVALLEQENVHLMEKVNHLRHDVGSQRNLLSKHQDVVMELAKGDQLPGFGRQLSRASLGSFAASLHSGFARRQSLKRSSTESTMSSDLDDCEKSMTREITMQSTMSSDSKPSFHLNLQSLSREVLQQLPTSDRASSSLQQPLLEKSSWQEVGEEASTPEEGEHFGNCDPNIGTTADSDGLKDIRRVLYNPNVVDIDGKSVCSQRSDQTSNSAAWWGGTNFCHGRNLIEQCPVSAREKQLLAKKKHLPERYVIHTPAEPARRSHFGPSW